MRSEEQDGPIRRMQKRDSCKRTASVAKADCQLTFHRGFDLIVCLERDLPKWNVYIARPFE